jgi:di/tricarboxylate transporter
MNSSGSDPSPSHALDLEHADLLAKVKLFAGLDRVTLAKLAARLESVTVPHGTELFRQGDQGDAFYLVARGTLGAFVSADDGRPEQRVNTFNRGDPFAEMALLTDHPRAATIRADTDAEVLRLERARFLALVQEEPSVALAIAASLGDRLRARDLPARQAGRAADERPPPDEPRAPARAAGRRRLSKAALGGLLAAAILVAGWSIGPPAGLTAEGWHAFVTVTAIVPLLALDALPDGIVALLLAAAWVLGGVVPPAAALSGFSSESWVLVVSVLVIGAAIGASGLLYRLALWTVAHSRGGFAGQATALCVAGVVLGPAAPNATARVTLVAPAMSELVEALGYVPRSRPAAGLAMATLIGFGQMAAPFLTSSTTAVLVLAVLPPSAQGQLTWLSWAALAAPANALLLLGLVASIVWLYRPRSAADTRGLQHGVVRLQRKLLGRLTHNERVALVVGAALLLGFVTEPVHGVHPAWVAVLAFAALAAMRVVTANTLRAVNWSFALLFGMLASMSKVFSGTGLDRWIATSVAGVVGPLATVPLLFVATLTLLCFAVSFVLRWQAAAPLITIALAPVAGAAGIHPFVVGMVALIACNGFFLPYQSTTYLAMYHGSGGKLFTHAQARPAAIAYGAVTLLALCASVVAWHAMGLL